MNIRRRWGSLDLWNILNSSCLSSRCQQSWRTSYVGAFPKNMKVLVHVGSYCQIALSSTIGKDTFLTACYGGWWYTHFSVSGSKVSVMDVVAPTSVCVCHNSYLMVISHRSDDATMLLSSTLVRRMIVFGVQIS